MKSEEAVTKLVQALGPQATFVEVGVLRATTLSWVADHCENVEEFIGVDFYQPYQDYLFVSYAVNQALANLNFSVAKEKIAASKNHAKIRLVVKDCVLAASDFEDSSLSCVFLDAYMTEPQVIEHIHAWLPKVKNGGVLCGHDIESPLVQSGLESVGLRYDVVCRDVWAHFKN